MASSSVGPQGPYHIILRDKPSPATSVGLVLDVDEDGGPRVRESRSAIIPPRQSEGAIDFSHQDPMVDLTYAVTDFSGGALTSLWDPRHANFYAQADGLDARWQNVLQLGMKRNGPMNFIIRNSGFEDGDTDWTDYGSPNSTIMETSIVRTGTNSMRIEGIDTGKGIKQSFQNPTVYRSKEISVYCYARRNDAAVAATVRLSLYDGVGTTNGSGVAMSTSWQLLTVTRTMNAAATEVTLRLDSSSESGSVFVYVDDFFVLPTGGVENHGTTMGPRELIKQGGLEDNSVASWTNENLAVDPGGGDVKSFGAVTTAAAVHTGTYGLSVGVSGQTQSYDPCGRTYQTLDATTTPTAASLQGTVFRIEGWLRGVEASDANVLYVFINDGTSQGESDNTLVVGQETYTKCTAELTIGDSATTIKFGVEGIHNHSSGRDFDWYGDDFHAYTIPIAYDFYSIFGRGVYIWDETSDTWDLVYLHATTVATDITEINGQVLVAYGGSGDNYYIRGQGVYWTTSGTADADRAHFWTISREKVWKTRFDGLGFHNFVNSGTLVAPTPESNVSWGTEARVGGDLQAITGLYAVNGTVVVGKVDGLYMYNRVADDDSEAATWVNLTRQYSIDPDEENFARGTEFRSWLYLSAKNQGFYRFNGHQIQDITDFLFDPKQGDFGGRVRAMTFGSSQVFLLIDTPTTDTTVNKETWLLSLRESEGGFSVHTLEKVQIGLIDDIQVNGNYLWAFGRAYNSDISGYESAIYRWDLPEKTVSPADDPTPLINTSGTITLSRWNGGVPNIQKALISALVIGENLDAEHSVQVKLGVDGAAATTTTWGTLVANKDTLTVADFSTPTSEAIGYDFQFQLTLSTDDTVSPKVNAIVFKFVLAPEIKKTWEVMAWIGTPLRTGQMREGVALSKTTLIANLKTLETQVYPIQLVEDFDQDDNETATYVKIREWERMPSDLEDERRGSRPTTAELYRVMLQEV